MSKYSKEFKEEALKLSDEIGVKKAALQLGLQYYMLADWRKARKYAKKHTVVLTENEATEIQDKENLIKRDFTADKPVKKLLTDITEVQCLDGKLYISPIMDCYNGEILTVEIRDNIKKELCIDTVYQLKQRCGNLQGVVLHSDRGSQYTCEAYRKLLKNCGIMQSLSGTGHCYDNARMESFLATLKKEKLYQIPTYRMKKEEVKTIVFRYIFIYYNRIRLYTGNPGCLPPSEYRIRDREKTAA